MVVRIPFAADAYNSGHIFSPTRCAIGDMIWLRWCMRLACASLLLSPILGPLCFGPTLRADPRLARLSVDFLDHTAGAWGRYVISDGSVRRTGWLTTGDDHETYAISAIRLGSSSRVRAILYASGCSVQTANLPIREAKTYHYIFHCEPVPQTELRGTVSRIDRLYGRQVTVEAKYVVPWASAFFGYDDGTTTEIPLGNSTTLDQKSAFVLPVPDLSMDRSVKQRDDTPEIRVWLRDKSSGRIVGQLRPASAKRSSRFGGLGAASLPLAPLEVFTPCAANPPGAHDQFGFGIRPASDDACD